MSLGNALGAWTTAIPLACPNASSPVSETMKLRLLFSIDGNGWTGSSRIGLTIGRSCSVK